MWDDSSTTKSSVAENQFCCSRPNLNRRKLDGDTRKKPVPRGTSTTPTTGVSSTTRMAPETQDQANHRLNLWMRERGFSLCVSSGEECRPLNRRAQSPSFRQRHSPTRARKQEHPRRAEKWLRRQDTVPAHRLHWEPVSLDASSLV
jgi:hypothetical protein